MRSLRGIREGAGASTAADPDVWRSDRIAAFALLDNARLLQSYRLATLVLRDRDEAEDATQEAIEKAWLAWRTLRERDHFDAWFDRILVNVCRNRMRRSRIIRMVALDDAHHVQSPDSHASTVARLALEPAFGRLTPDQRIILVLRFWRDLPIEDLAERLGIPEGTAKSRLHYALRALRRAIETTEEASR